MVSGAIRNCGNMIPLAAGAAAVRECIAVEPAVEVDVVLATANEVRRRLPAPSWSILVARSKSSATSKSLFVALLPASCP
jgi:hypothetical protein